MSSWFWSPYGIQDQKGILYFYRYHSGWILHWKIKTKQNNNKSWGVICAKDSIRCQHLRNSVQMKSVIKSLNIWLSFLLASPLWSNKAWATPKLFSFWGLILIFQQLPHPIHVGATPTPHPPASSQTLLAMWQLPLTLKRCTSGNAWRIINHVISYFF